MAVYGTDVYGTGTYGAVVPPPPPSPPVIVHDLPGQLRQSHALAVEVDVLSGGAQIATLQPISGSVTLDSASEIRGSCEVAFVDRNLIPTSPDDLLTPFGNELRLKRGVRYPDGTTDLISLGIFRIESAEVFDSGEDLEVRVSGRDRAAAVSDAKFEAPWPPNDPTTNRPTTTKGVPMANLIQQVVNDAVDFDFIFDNRAQKDAPAPILVAEEGEDRWTFATGLATAMGCELFWGDQGELILRDVPSPTAVPTVSYTEGEGGVLLEVTKTWSRTDVFNRVIVTIENSDSLPGAGRGVATDDSIDSPTSYYGRFGRSVYFWSNPYVTTLAQANDAATGILHKQIGIGHSLNFGSLVDPTLRPGTVALFRRQRLGVNEVHVVDTVTIPLDAESSMAGSPRIFTGEGSAMGGTTRRLYEFKVELGQQIPPPPAHLLFSPDVVFDPDQPFF